MFASWKRLITRLEALLRPGYRPERYYMRGPGPACARRGRNGLTLS
ncbi:hypothetical protein U0C82_05325 [Fulvimarina sp. 2208YS6-2-32]|uniref:Uncharacterized protein n=1 Tax=Fulvimarina uroteuthidis TaxID=3098149 RepID=A0ABU5HZU2_9HYPH|nr:hypothetical protein [Fulvimarina sp. 2208YS6-2-32]MDY8108575.1 hypothetical protein [Fulvimarina sp. 2208YS6-2-32]